MTPRKHSSKWRVLAQDAKGNRVSLECEGTEFDEIAVGNWLHLEQLDTGSYYALIGDARLTITIDKRGRVTLDVTRGDNGEVRGTTETVGR